MRPRPPLTPPAAATPPSLAGSAWLEAPQTQAVMAAIVAGGHEVRAVGGVVRNSLLGLPVTDIDLATTALPDQVMGLAAAAGLHAVPTGIDHGTVTVIADHVPFEVTTLRQDVETHGRHATVAFTADWAADAGRRDFTVNALYCDASGTVLDPLGGYPDLAARRIRFIGDARQRIREDYLRILRFYRFTAEYAEGPPDPDGLAATIRERGGLAGLSGERIRQEIVRLMLARRAMDGIDAMIAQGLLSPLLGAAPRPTVLARLIAIDERHGLAPDPMLRLAACAVATSEDADSLAKRLRVSSDERATLHLAYRFAPAGDAPDAAAQRERLYRLGEAHYCAVTALDLARCIAIGIADPAWTAALALPKRWKPPRFPLRGADVLAAGIPPGPRVGELLREIEAWWIASGFDASLEDCRARLAILMS